MKMTREEFNITLSYMEDWLDLERPPRSQYTPREILCVLMYASQQNKTIHQACRELDNAPHANTIFNLLYPLKVEDLEEKLNRTVRSLIPPEVFNTSKQVAIDYKLIPTWVDESKLQEEERQYIIRSKAKEGTNRFYAFASIYLIKKGKRYTVGLVMVKRGMSKVEVIRKLLKLFREAGGEVKCLYLDREFYCVDVISYLQGEKIPFLMAVRKSEGIKRLINQKGVGIHDYVVRSREKEVKVKIVVVGTYLKGKRGKKGRKIYVYAIHLYPYSLRGLYGVHHRYRNRFGIESSHRLWERSRGRTASRRGVLRFVLLGIGVLFYNVWVYLVSQAVRRGEIRFTFQSYLTLLRREIEGRMCGRGIAEACFAPLVLSFMISVRFFIWGVIYDNVDDSLSL